MTERKSMESERAELVALNEWMREPDYAENFSLADITDWINRRPIATAARLAAQDQKPVAWRTRWRTEVPHEPGDWSYYNQKPPQDHKRYEVEPLYLSPPPAAGWDEAIEACKQARPDEFGPVQSKQPKVNVREFVEALRHNAPPDSGAGKSGIFSSLTPEQQEQALNCRDDGMSSSVMPDHGGADAGVRDILAAVLFAKWSGEAKGWPEDEWSAPDWGAWRNRTKLNPVGLSRTAFEEEADFLLKEVQPALSKPAPVAANDADQINALAHRFWSVHPREIQDMGITREQFYQREMTALVENISDQRRRYQSVVLNPDQIDLLLSNAPVAAKASAEARLMEALEEINKHWSEPQTVRWIVRKSLSTHPHASDCDKQGEATKSEASSHEKRRLDASGELTSTGPETSISPVRTIAQMSASAPSANHDVTAGRDRHPSDGTADVTVEGLAQFLRDADRETGQCDDDDTPAGYMDLARALLDAFTVGKRLSDKQGER